MDRKLEYEALLRDLEETPTALEDTLRRVRARRSRQRRRRLGSALAGVGGVAAAFVLLMNTSVPFALACAGVPGLRKLAAAVVFSPSLRAAVENEYVQYLGLSQTAGGATVRMEYAIVDQKQVDLFFTVDGAEGDWPCTTTRFRAADGGDLPSIAWTSPILDGDSGTLYQITVDFTQSDVPESMILDLEIWPDGSADRREGAEPQAAFSFDLRLDPRYTAQGETIRLDRWFQLGDQRLYAACVEVYPTHVRLELEDDPENTAWLRSLDFCLEDGSGRRYEKIANGITATGSTGTPFMPSHRLESTWFGDAEGLRLCITGAEWLDKDGRDAVVDLEDGTAAGLPEGVSLQRAERTGDRVELTFRAAMRDGGADMRFHQLFTGNWTAPDGATGSIEGWSTQTARDWTPGETPVELPDQFDTTFALEDCPWPTVRLELDHTRYETYAAPVELPVG